MLASRFTNMKSPSKVEKNPKVSGAIDKLLEASREYNDAKLVDLVQYMDSHFVRIYVVGHARR